MRNHLDRQRETRAAARRVRSQRGGQRSDGFFQVLENRQLLSGTVASGGVTPLIEPSVTVTADASAAVKGYTPSQIATAYGTNGISFGSVKGTGAGQTIAIVDAYNDPNINNDLNTFDSQFGLSSANLTVLSETGSSTKLPANNAGWDTEISLDVEWAHAVAPAAKLVLVEANSANLNDLLTAVNEARNLSGVSVVSMSWGGSEFYGETGYDYLLTTPAGHTNETFVAASGDDYATEWPAVSPNVLAVGGTELNTSNSSGAFSSEKPWAPTGGGYSSFETEPAYQDAVQTTGRRTTPDVSYDADPSSGVAVYDSVSYDGMSGWQEVGGTSAGAPQWAGLVAIADQGRSNAGKAALNTVSLQDAIYAAGATSSADDANFHDVWGGSVGGSSNVFQPRTATYGYDLLTGLGSPRGSATDNVLVNATARTTAVAPAGATALAAATRAIGADAVALAVAPVSNSAVSVLGMPAENMANGSEMAALIRNAAWVGADAGSATAPPLSGVFGESMIADAHTAAVGGEGPALGDAAAGRLALVGSGSGTEGQEPRALGAAWTGVVSATQAVVPAAVLQDVTALLGRVTPVVDSAVSLAWSGLKEFRFVSGGGAVPASGSIHTWRLAAAAALAGAGFVWWWTEDERRTQRERADADEADPARPWVDAGPLRG